MYTLYMVAPCQKIYYTLHFPLSVLFEVLNPEGNHLDCNIKEVNSVEVRALSIA